MAWEQRKNARYYYRSRRVGDSVRRDYMGRGQEATLSAELDLRRREQSQVDLTSWADFVSRLGKADRLLEDLTRDCRLLVSAVMLSAGYHCWNGEWRRRRVYRTRSSSN
jgi:hypothetical protein